MKADLQQPINYSTRYHCVLSCHILLDNSLLTCPSLVHFLHGNRGAVFKSTDPPRQALSSLSRASPCCCSQNKDPHSENGPTSVSPAPFRAGLSRPCKALPSWNTHNTALRQDWGARGLSYFFPSWHRFLQVLVVICSRKPPLIPTPTSGFPTTSHPTFHSRK